jgi:hypothetical protein
MFKICVAAATVVIAAQCPIATASIVEVWAVPTDWKVENYVGSQVALWSTGSPCNGALTLPSSATIADHDRLFALLMAAKLANRQIFVRYENTNCELASFGMQSP